MVSAWAECPGHLQPPPDHLAVDLQQVAARRLRALRWPDRLTGQRQPCPCGQAPFHLPQVVEAHPRRRQPTQPLPQFLVAAEVAQQPVADAAVGHRTQLLLDRLQRLARPAPRGHLQQHRVQRGEPAHRARQVDVVEQLLAAVPLQVHQQRTLTAPADVRLRQGGQQHVVDLGAVDRGHLLQQRPRLLLTQGHHHRLRRAGTAVPLDLVHRQRR